MKKIILIALCILLAVPALGAIAQNTGASYNIPSVLKRNNPGDGKTFAANPVIPGESTITGLPLAEKPYLPILVQFDNNLGALPQWGLASADIMYEMPIQGEGWTRMTGLFSDKYPLEAGPVRSARVMHVDLREEWDAVLVNFGKQEEGGSDARQALIDYGVNKKGLSVEGIGNAYAAYFARVKYHAAPHNVTAYISKLKDLMQEKNYPFPLRPFKFADSPVYAGPDAVKVDIVHKLNPDTASVFVYDAAAKGYLRYTVEGAYYDLLEPATQLVYNNLIVQRTKLGFNGHSLNPIFPDIVGKGAADIFIGGKYIAGAWVRKSLQDRTVFLDEQGNELVLQRGKTWVCVTDENTAVSLHGDISGGKTMPEIAPAPIAAAVIPDATQANAAQQDQPGFVVDNTAQADIPASAVKEEDAVPTPTVDDNPKEVAEQPEVDNNLPLQEEPERYATVATRNRGTLNFRESPKSNAKIIDQIPYGTRVQVLSQDGEWANIRVGTKDGYVMTSYLKLETP